MAVGGCSIVDGCEVGQRVVVAWYDMVDRVGSGFPAKVADSLVSFEDDSSSCLPIAGEAGFPCGRLEGVG